MNNLNRNGYQQPCRKIIFGEKSYISLTKPFYFMKLSYLIGKLASNTSKALYKYSMYHSLALVVDCFKSTFPLYTLIKRCMVT